MRLKKLIFVPALLALFITSCDFNSGGGSKHEHTYSEEWSSDDEYHWHDSTCGHDVISGKEQHSYVKIGETQPSFESEGFITYECSVCKHQKNEKNADKLEHNFSEEWEHDGTHHWHKCLDEGYPDVKGSYEEHDFEEEVVQPTYDAKGYTLHTCKVCKYSFKDNETEKLEHNFSDEWEHNETHHWHKCLDDGYPDVKGSYNLHDYKVEVVDPTYDNKGYTLHECKVCGYFYKDNETEKLEHKYSEKWSYNGDKHWHACIDEGFEYLSVDDAFHDYKVEVISPTYESKGYTLHKCKVCDYQYIDNETEKLEHKYSDEWSYNEEGHWHVCVDENYGDLKTPIEKHYFGEYVTDPTYDSQGFTKYVCYTCGYSYIGNYVPALSHQFSDEWSHDETKHWHACVDTGYENLTKDESNHDFDTQVVKPTYEKKGYTIHTCKVCKYSYQSDITDELIHQYSDSWSSDKNGHWHVCIDEGYEDLISDYSSHSFGDWIVTTEPGDFTNGIKERKCNVCQFKEEATIASKVEESTAVVGFELSADGTYYIVRGFSAANITEVVIPSEYKGLPVKEIADEAFDFCYNITRVVLPDTIVSIGFRSFCGMNNLVSINIPSSLEYIGNYSFWMCDKLDDISLPSKLKSIGEAAFAGCKSLKTVTLNNGLEAIGDNAFSGCPLEAIQFPESLIHVGESAFSGTNLTEITIPSKITTISKFSFMNCAKLESISFGSGVTTICEQAFYGCDSLEQVSLPDNITVVKYAAFSKCINLTTLNVSNNILFFADGAVDGCEKLECYVEDGKKFIGNSTNPYLVLLSVDGFYDELLVNDGCRVVTGDCFEKGCNTLTLGKDVINVPRVGAYNYVIRNKFIVDANNSNFVAIDDVLYSTNGVLINSDDELYSASGTLIRVPLNKSGILNLPNIATSIGPFSFTRCYYIESVSVPGTVKTIGFKAFYGMDEMLSRTTNLSITLSNGLESIGKGAFQGSTIQSISLPASLKEYGDYTTYQTGSLMYISVDANNEFYASQDGILYDKIENSILVCPSKATGVIEIRDGTKNIVKGTFNRCQKITEIHIPASVTRIDAYSFDYCLDMERVTVANESNSYVVINNVLYTKDKKDCVFCPVNNDGDITLPDEIEQIYDYAFDYCKIASVDVSNLKNLKYVGNQAFANCENIELLSFAGDDELTNVGFSFCAYCYDLQVVNISSKAHISERDENGSSRSISDSFFACNSLKNIIVEPDNPYYKSIDGVLFNNNEIPGYERLRLLLFPGRHSSTYHIPDGTNEIESKAFSHGANSYSDLVYLYVPSSVKYIRDYVFSNCGKLETIEYGGTMAEWGEIYLANYWINSNSPVTSIICTDGNVEIIKEF